MEWGGCSDLCGDEGRVGDLGERGGGGLGSGGFVVVVGG